ERGWVVTCSSPTRARVWTMGSIRCDACSAEGPDDWRWRKNGDAVRRVLSNRERPGERVAAAGERNVLQNRGRTDRSPVARPSHGEVLERVGKGGGPFPDTQAEALRPRNTRGGYA